MGWLQRRVRESKLLSVLICALVIAAIVGSTIYKFKYLQNVHQGPYDIPAAELIAAKSVEDLPRYWVRLTPARIFDTGVDHITVTKRRGVETGRSVSGHFWVAQVGDRILFVESHGARPEAGQVLTGFLVDPKPGTMSHLSQGLNPQGKAMLMPIMLDLGKFEADAYGGLGIGAAAIIFALVWAGFALRLAFKPEKHKRLRALQAASIPIDEAGQEIENEIRAGASLPVGSYRLTRAFLVKTGLGFDVRSLQDLLWIYPIVVSHRLLYVIPTGKSFELVMCFPDKQIKQKVPKDRLDRAAAAIAAHAPWVLIGHSPEIEAAWKHERSKLVAFVAERRAQVSAQAPAAHVAEGGSA